jgi:hypothetical protein
MSVKYEQVPVRIMIESPASEASSAGSTIFNTLVYHDTRLSETDKSANWAVG